MRTWFLICETTFHVDVSKFILICETLLIRTNGMMEWIWWIMPIIWIFFISRVWRSGCEMSVRLSCMCHDSLIFMTWLVSMPTWLVDMWTWLVMSVRLSCMCHDSLIFVTWLVSMLTWLVDMCDVTRDERAIALYVPWLVDICDVTH